jgi:CheY-like chemotaxis protein
MPPGMITEMKKVLVVDDDAVVRNFMMRILKPYEDELDVITAKNGKEAAEIITKNKIDLVVTDINMPEMDGFELLAHMTQTRPNTPVFVMTGNWSAAVEERLKAFGPVKYFEKPMNIDVFTEALLDELDSTAEGRIKGISLASFLQIVELEKKTCTLTIRVKNKTGTLYFIKGELIDAETGDKTGDAAALEMITWERPVIEIRDAAKKTKRNIMQPLMNILMEGMRIKDEKNSEKTPLKPPTKMKPE